VTPDEIDRLAEPFLKICRLAPMSYARDADRLGRGLSGAVKKLWDNRWLRNAERYVFDLNELGKSLQRLSRTHPEGWGMEEVDFVKGQLDVVAHRVSKHPDVLDDLQALDALAKEALTLVRGL
jgi:hypothetical protein